MNENNLDGITFEGKPLTDLRDEELLRGRRQEIIDQARSKKKRVWPNHYIDEKENNGKVHQYTKSEIAKEYGMNKTKLTNVQSLIVCLQQKNMTVKEIATQTKKKYNPISALVSALAQEGELIKLGKGGVGSPFKYKLADHLCGITFEKVETSFKKALTKRAAEWKAQKKKGKKVEPDDIVRGPEEKLVDEKRLQKASDEDIARIIRNEIKTTNDLIKVLSKRKGITIDIKVTKEDPKSYWQLIEDIIIIKITKDL